LHRVPCPFFLSACFFIGVFINIWCLLFIISLLQWQFYYMLQANQRIIELLFWLRNLWSHLAWFTWTKNSINDNDLFYSYDMYSKFHSMCLLWRTFALGKLLSNYIINSIIVIHCTIRLNVRHNELFLPNLWKCRCHVYWNLSYLLRILKVIFSKKS
jgi:hypothetical protein